MVIIAKLNQNWNGYRKKPLHNREDITLEELLKHLRIEEDTRSRDSKDKYDSSKVNVVEASRFSKNFKVKNDKKFKNSGNKSGNGPQHFLKITSSVAKKAITKINADPRRKKKK